MITVETIVNESIDKVWEYFTTPEHIVNWNAASADWHTTAAENDLRLEGKFTYKMAAKDGSFSFDFWGVYTSVIPMKEIAFTLGDNRKVNIKFELAENGVRLTETFEPETQNSQELQQAGWQAILNSFKQYVESN